jgi:hypothetical protein
MLWALMHQKEDFSHVDFSGPYVPYPQQPSRGDLIVPSYHLSITTHGMRTKKMKAVKSQKIVAKLL